MAFTASLYLALLLFISSCSHSLSDVGALNTKPFPKNFMFGVATSAYQVEGAWNTDGKGESIWDRFVHAHPDKILDHTNGDIACDSYHKLNEDIAILKQLGVSHYRLSIAWTRILPKGTKDHVNQAGVQYYKKLFKALRENGIEPMVTLFHWDLPQVFQDQGGFLNASITDHFLDYARICFELFGDDVKWWLTFNESKQTCEGGYGYGYFPPTIKKEGLYDYICGHNLIKTHAKIYHMYQKEFKAKQNGKLSITIDTATYVPKTSSAEDKVATERAWAFEFGWFANPIFNGDYPAIMKTRVAARSKAEGYAQSRLPAFTKEEVAYIKGTHDYFAVNTYSGSLVSAISEPGINHQQPSRYSDMGYANEEIPGLEIEANGWRVYPLGMRQLMKHIKDTYNNPPIIITENGYNDAGGLNDDGRINYLNAYLSNLRDAIEHDGCNVIGYMCWSLMDNFEWTSGYAYRFGLFSVDFNSPNRTRTIKKSGLRYKEIVKNKHL